MQQFADQAYSCSVGPGYDGFSGEGSVACLVAWFRDAMTSPEFETELSRNHVGLASPKVWSCATHKPSCSMPQRCLLSSRVQQSMLQHVDGGQSTPAARACRRCLTLCSRRPQPSGVPKPSPTLHSTFFPTMGRLCYGRCFTTEMGRKSNDIAYAPLTFILAIAIAFRTVSCVLKNSKALPIGDGVPVSGTPSLGPGSICE